MIYFCAQKNRRSLILQDARLNGIDYLEVCGSDDPDCGCGKQLFLTLLKDAPGLKLGVSQLRFTGGAALAQVSPVSITPATKDRPKTLTITLNKPGDFSAYNLTLVANPHTDDPPDGFDPQLSTVDFSFKAGCPTTGDCVPTNCCPPVLQQEPDINYLAKDYEAFRQVMLDRMAVTAPGWTERHPSDLGIALVEQLAYVADHLSYQQDAAGTEAYLGTARNRISLSRHARLVDYRLNEGCNARTWVYLKVNPNAMAVPLPTGTLLFPQTGGFSPVVKPTTTNASSLLRYSSVVFATMQDALLYGEQNEMHFYTWSDNNCCLAPGATEATLLGNLTSLQPGTVLIFKEIIGPDTASSADADPAKRWAVRLTRVRSTDFHNNLLADPLTGKLITRIYWDTADALPFPLCLSSRPPGEKELVNVSVALGNIVPADHGLWGAQGIVGDQWNDITKVQCWEDLHKVPEAPLGPAPGTGCICGSTSQISSPRSRYYPELSKSGLTFARAADFTAPASAFQVPASGAPAPKPQIFVFDDSGQQWQNAPDVLGSFDTQPVFLVEIERDDRIFVRFGDGEYGMAPQTGMSFRALYRVGNGTVGNIGHDSLAHVLSDETRILAVTNPLPGVGGVDPETMEHIRQQAPYAFRTQLRAVTENDYGTMAQQDPAIREARGTLRWTGSWYTAFTSIDAASDLGTTPALIAATKKRLDLFRMAGVDLDTEAARLVGLRIEMNVCVDADFFQTDVRDAIVRLLTVGNLCDGTPGLLNPKNFTFGQTIYTSPLVAAAQKVDGVVSAQISVFQRVDDPSQDGSAQGFLTMGRLEIGRCDNNPNRLDRGILALHMDGGK